MKNELFKFIFQINIIKKNLFIIFMMLLSIVIYVYLVITKQII
jgi:hypothetical protein